MWGSTQTIAFLAVQSIIFPTLVGINLWGIDLKGGVEIIFPTLVGINPIGPWMRTMRPNLPHIRGDQPWRLCDDMVPA